MKSLRKIYKVNDFSGLCKKLHLRLYPRQSAAIYTTNTILMNARDFYNLVVKLRKAQIDYANGEYGKYNNSITLYNTAFDAYAKYYNRTHKPISKNFTHF